MLHWHIISRREDMCSQRSAHLGQKVLILLLKLHFSFPILDRDTSQSNNESRWCRFCVKSCLSHPYLRTKSCYWWQLNLIPQLLILDPYCKHFVQPRSGRGKQSVGHASKCSVMSLLVSIDHVQTTPVARGDSVFWQASLERAPCV